jgi:hypothetical protein
LCRRDDLRVRRGDVEEDGRRDGNRHG